jgi:hypothetical protein
MKPCKLPTILIIIFRNPTSLLPTIIINLSSSSSYETCKLSHHQHQFIKLIILQKPASFPTIIINL